MRITEFKKSVHRKYTKDYQSYGFRVGMMFQIDEGDDPIKAYDEAMKVLDTIVSKEDALIYDLMNDDIPKEDLKNYMVENQEIEKVYPDTPKELDSKENIVYESMGICNHKDCDCHITWKLKVDGKFPAHLSHDGTLFGDGRCPIFK